MYFFTHLFISKVLYQHLANEVELNQRAFSYGNIKPDLPSSKRNHHTLEKCLDTVCEYSNQLRNKEMSIEDYSVRLGEICHYISDFFCFYHLSEELHDRKLHHFLYEIRLHMSLFHLKNNFKNELLSSTKEPRKNIESMILEMRMAYFSQIHHMEMDVEYALMASVWICDSIIYFSKYASDLSEESEQILYKFMFAQGGKS
ncbi:MAG: zinc dependent phospholipase C family protein [Lachnotalea sp.]